MAHKNVDYDPETLRYPDQKIVKSELVKEMETSYIEYAMSVIVSRAIPEIDGFKPSHRKLLYTMYKMGLLSGGRTKSANIVGQTMRLNPHGDAAIYETMVRLAKGNETLLHPFVDSKGNFGKVYSRDMAYAASRYTEAKLESICSELFGDIDKDTVDFTPNYDDRLKEPTVLPVRFPQLLVNGSSGIAFGMATEIPPHNLGEVCDAIDCLIENPDAELEDLMEHIKGPDFPTGGIIMGRAGIRAAYATGRAKVIVRAKCEIVEGKNGKFKIIVTEIPYMVNKLNLVKAINDLIDEKRVDGGLM